VLSGRRFGPRTGLLVLAAVLAFALLSLGAAAAGATATTATPTRAEIKRDYDEILATLDPRLPGRGVDVTHATPKNEPPAFAGILGAEGLRYKVTGSHSALRRARRCGRWLLRNSDLNHNGVVGWGLPSAYDAFGDGTLNPANTEYTITTASVINKLLEWPLFDRRAPRRRIHAAIRRAFAPYLRVGRSSSAGRTPTGLFGYSLLRHDRRFDVYNVGAFMAGVMQRASRRLRGRSLRRRLRAAADENMRVLLRARRASPAGRAYWLYGTEPGSRSNELGHASIIIRGVRAYQRNAGRLRRGFRSRPLLDHVGEFRAGERWLRRPAFDGRPELITGTGGLPFSLAFSEPRLRHLESSLLGELRRHELSPGRYETGRPSGPRSTIRGQAGVLSHLAERLYRRRARYRYY
jgi:hypothetical protein